MSLLRRVFPELNQMMRMMDEPFTGRMMSRVDPLRGGIFDIPTFEPLRLASRSIPMDLKESKSQYELVAELPGVNKKDINIEVKDDRTLIITGKMGHDEGGPEGETVTAYEDQAQGRGQGPYDASSDVQIDESDGVIPSGAEKMQRDKASQSMKLSVSKAEESDVERYWNSERILASFQRSITFPSPFQTDKIEARLKNGLLSVLLPKIPEKKGIQINVSD